MLAFLHLFWINQCRTSILRLKQSVLPLPHLFLEQFSVINIFLWQYSVNSVDSHLGNGASLLHATSEPKQYRCPILCLSRSLWMAAQPSGVSTALPSLVSATKFLRVPSAPPSGSFMKVLNSIDPSTSHRGTPLVTVLKMDFVLLMTSPLSLECSQFPVYPTASLSHPELTSLPMKKLQCQKPC